MKLKEIADRIYAHLKRFETDPKINKNTKPDRSGLSLYFWAGAGVAGNRVYVKYINYQEGVNLKKAEAIKYLEKLDAGFVGRHYEALRD